MARWLGSGLIAVSGMDADLRNVWGRGVDLSGKSQPAVRKEIAYAGLQLLDTRSWTTRTLDPRASGFEWQGGRLIAYARPPTGSGGDALVAFDRTGRLAYRVRGTKNTYWRAFNDRIYLFGDHPSRLTTVLDASDGRKLGHAHFDRLIAVGPC